MPTYAVINKALAALQDPPIAADAEVNPARVYRYASAEAVPWVGMEFATHDHVQVADPAPVPEAPREPVRLTKLEFRDRFTTQEKVGIEFASMDAPAAPLEDRLRAAQLRVFLEDVASATPDPDGKAINIDDPRTIGAVQMLEAVGLIGPGRAAEILGGA